jgi:predicted alpha/beta-fold hydrolase
VARSLDREFNDPPSQWYQEPEADKPVVIFVHGILSNGSRTWMSGAQEGWARLLAGDAAFRGWGIVVANWYSTVFSESRTLEQEAEGLYNELQTPLNGEKVPFAAKKIIFIAHSMGGLVVRQMLVQHQELCESAEISVVTLSTPALGANIAALLAALSTATQHAQALALRPSSEVLATLHSAFKKFVGKHTKNVTGIELVEELLVAQRVRMPLQKQIRRLTDQGPPLVSYDDQGKYFGDPVIIHGTDHASIARPKSRRERSYQVVKEFLLHRA